MCSSTALILDLELLVNVLAINNDVIDGQRGVRVFSGSAAVY